LVDKIALNDSVSSIKINHKEFLLMEISDDPEYSAGCIQILKPLSLIIKPQSDELENVSRNQGL
jgi:hypothetical protein